MQDCYATGAVTGATIVGGLVGYNEGTVTGCYATGAISGDTNLGGLIGSGDAPAASFWDITVGGPDNGLGAGLPTGQMQQRATFEGVGWDFSDGDGDPADWFIAEDLSYPLIFGLVIPLGSVTSLQLLDAFADGEFLLTGDIDASATADWPAKSTQPGFLPIGSAASPFSGTLHGNGHRISGLHIYRPAMDQVGLFGYIGAGGVVDGVGLETVTITGQNQVGGLAGVNLGTVDQCYVQGGVSGVNGVGGLVGENQGSVTESYSATTLSGGSTGGLIGADNGGSASVSFWDTDVSGTISSGGGTGLPTSAMQSESTFAAAGWDMAGAWSIVDGYSYPYFQNSELLRVVTGPARLIDADAVNIVVRALVPQLFVTIGGGAYPAYQKFEAAGQATISVLLKQEAINRLVISLLSETGVETLVAEYEVYESAAFPSTPTAVAALILSPLSVSLAQDETQQFWCTATFADGTTGDVTPTASWNVSGGRITANGLYRHWAGTVTVQALLHTRDGWHYSNLATVTTGKQGQSLLADSRGQSPFSGAKAEVGHVSGVVLSHYTGLGLADARVTAYNIFNPTVAGQYPVHDSMGNYAFFMDEGIYHGEGACPGHRSELAMGGWLLEPLRMIDPGPPPEWSEPYYSGQVKENRPLQYDFALRPNDTQAPWVVFIEPVADTTVNRESIIVTAIDTDKYSELEVAKYTHNAQEYAIPDQISSTGFYRDTWPLELGLNVLHLYTMDTESNASEKTIQITYDPGYVWPGLDTDRDGLPNTWETLHGLDPNSAEGINGANGDFDEDGLTNLQEYQLGSFPNSAHSDADTLPDGFEFDLGTNLLDADTDGDGINDDVELELGSDPLRDDRIKMAVVSPADGMSVRGNAVTVLAEVLGGDGPGGVASVSVELKGAGTGGIWRVLNTDIEAPFTATWDTTLYPEGTYQLRAVATSQLGHVDDSAATVSVTVSASAAYHERIEGATHLLTAPVSASADTILALWDGVRFARILIPAGALPADDVLTAFFPDSSGFTPSLSIFQHDAGLYLDVSLDSGLTDFLGGKQATIHLSYPDADRDDHLDDAPPGGVGLCVPFLSMAYLATPTGAFTPIAASWIDRSMLCLVGETTHFSVFGVVEEWPPPPLNLLTDTLPPGTVGAVYNAALEANGGAPPYAWTVAGGALPDGLGIAGSSLQGTPTAAGDFSFTLEVSDSQSPPYTATWTYEVNIYEATQPTVTVTRATGQPGIASGLPATWDIVFSEAVTGFETSDIVLEGTASYGAMYEVTGSGAAYTLAVTVLTYDGTLHPTAPAGVAASVATSALNRASADEEEVWVDTTAPQVQITSAYAGLQEYGETGPIVVTVLPVVFDLEFSEDVAGLDAADIEFAEIIAGLSYVVEGSGKSYTLIIDGADGATTVTPSVLLDAVLDSAGNGNAETAYSGREVQYSPETRATVMLEQAAGQADPVNGFPIAFTIEFSEAVTGFETGDVDYVGDAPNPEYTVSGSGTTYALTLTGTSGDGRAAFTIPEDVVDGGNSASTSLDNVVDYDATAPGITLGAPSASTTATGPVSFTVTYGGATAVTLGTSDITLNGTPTAQVSVTGTGTILRVVTLSGILGYGPLGISIAAGTASDAAGNPASAAGPSVTFDVDDGAPPSVTVDQAVSQSDPTNTLPIVFDVVFSEVVTGFDEADISMGGTATGVTFEVNGSGATYTIDVTAVSGNGTLEPTVNAGVCQDLAGNPNQASTSTDNIVTYDSTSPSVTVNQAVGQADPTNALPIVFDVVFNEPVTGFNETDVMMGGTAAGATLEVNGSGDTYTIDVTDVTGDGTLVSSVGAGVCQDAAGNPNLASTSTDNSVAYDATAPSVTVEQAAAQADPTKALPITFDVVLSEVVDDFQTGDVLIEGTATGVNHEVTGSGDTYTISVTTVMSDGTIIPSIPSGVAHDAAGNPNLSSTSTDNIVTYDSTPPSLSDIAAVPSPAGENALVTITFTVSEELEAAPTVTVNGNPAAYDSQVGYDYTYTYTVLGTDPNGAATIAISGTDLAGNPGTEENTSALVIDHTKPTANFTAAPRRGQPPLEVQFTDASAAIPGTPITDWSWDFGDGPPLGSGQIPAPHTYAAAGVYTVTLTVTDAAMNSDSETKTDYVVVGGPTADFTASPTSGYAPLQVQFTDTSEPGASPITEWLWDFGDETTSPEQSPAHTYLSGGDYTVTLTVTNAVASDTRTEQGYISVEPGIPPVANFAAEPTNGEAPLTVQFTDLSAPGTSAITDWFWDFGDDATSSEQHPEHTYEAPGVYTVSLTVTTDAGVHTLVRPDYITVNVPLPTLGLVGLTVAVALLSLCGAVAAMRKRLRGSRRVGPDL